MPKTFSFSYEFFPPKTPALEEKMWEAAGLLGGTNPLFASVTYGAGGSTQHATLRWVQKLIQEKNIPTAAHLTCVGATRADVDALAAAYWQAGVRHVVALRGDAPQGMGRYVPHPEGYAYAADLVAGLKKIADFEISVAAYPEIHPEATSAEADIDVLKRKQDAGATRAITQFFFENDVFFRFQEKAQRAGVTMPIIPGVLPVYNIEQVARFAKSCGAHVPVSFIETMAKVPVEGARLSLAAHFLIKQCEGLRAGGVEHCHVYTLNRADIPLALFYALGL